MRAFSWLTTTIIALGGSGLLTGQSLAPPQIKKPDAATLDTINEKTRELFAALKELHEEQAPDWLRCDVEVFYKAALWIVKHEEWYHEKYAEWTLEILDRGLERARQLRQGQMPWLAQTGKVARGYRSRIDGSVQPYGVVLPRNFDKDRNKKWRLDVVLHGRDAALTEVKFLHQHEPAPADKEQDFIQLNIYGRGNNAYRWAGEMDVVEALGAFIINSAYYWRRNVVDAQRTVLRGFSMGGAGTWQLGLHQPSTWCAISPGAGFTTTHGYVKGLPAELPPHQEACLRIYDAVAYAENAFNTQVVAYGGEKDPQLQAARNIEERLKPLGIPMKLIVGPDTAHRYHPESEKEIFRLLAEHAEQGGKEYPPRVRFVTHTPVYPICHWVMIRAQERQYERSLVDAERTDQGFRVKTANVRQLSLRMPADAPAREKQVVDIDGEKLEVPPLRLDATPRSAEGITLEKRAGRWAHVILPKVYMDDQRARRKNWQLPGPIDAAFMQPFLCVRGTGKPWHAATQRFADQSLERFQREWSKYFRGELRVMDDRELTAQDFEGSHLVLFGDPASNSLIAQALDRLPLQWTREHVTFAGKPYPADAHVPVLIYPSPFHASNYVVLNTGHTFHAADFQGTNALLYPRLGDYAILKLVPTEKDPLAVEVATAGLFDENWQVPQEKQPEKP